MGSRQGDDGGKTTEATKHSDAISMLKEDHRKVEGLFSEFENAKDQRKSQIIEEVCKELTIHATLEERIFYPAAWQAAEDKVDEAQVEHDSVKILILELERGDPSDEYYMAKFKVLAEMTKQHIKEEEAADGILAKAQRAGINTRELSQRLSALKQQLQERAKDGRLPAPVPVSLSILGNQQRGGRGYEEERGHRDYRGGQRGDWHEGRSFRGRDRDYDDYDYDDREPRRSEAGHRSWQNRR